MVIVVIMIVMVMNMTMTLLSPSPRSVVVPPAVRHTMMVMMVRMIHDDSQIMTENDDGDVGGDGDDDRASC